MKQRAPSDKKLASNTGEKLQFRATPSVKKHWPFLTVEIICDVRRIDI